MRWSVPQEALACRWPCAEVVQQQCHDSCLLVTSASVTSTLQVRRSKLHFVDLAGSERVGKSGLAAHLLLKEAKYINLSLHFLEQVCAGGRWGLGPGRAVQGGCPVPFLQVGSAGSTQRPSALLLALGCRGLQVSAALLLFSRAGHHLAAGGAAARAVPQLAAHHGAARLAGWVAGQAQNQRPGTDQQLATVHNPVQRSALSVRCIACPLTHRHPVGGNTRTVMVAAVAPEAQHIEESISTCRFAQRVAMISNK